MNELEIEIRDLMETNLTTTFKKYYAGRVQFPPKQFLPVLMVYGTTTEVDTANLTTSRDKYLYTIKIEIIENVYSYVNEAGINADKILNTQQAIKLKMEDRTNGVPDSDTVLGVLRRNISGTNYLYMNNIRIDYEEESLAGSIYFKGILTVDFAARYAARS